MKVVGAAHAVPAAAEIRAAMTAVFAPEYKLAACGRLRIADSAGEAPFACFEVDRAAFVAESSIVGVVHSHSLSVPFVLEVVKIVKGRGWKDGVASQFLMMDARLDLAAVMHRDALAWLRWEAVETPTASRGGHGESWSAGGDGAAREVHALSEWEGIVYRAAANRCPRLRHHRPLRLLCQRNRLDLCARERRENIGSD